MDFRGFAAEDYDYNDRIEDLEEARQHLEEAIALITTATRGTDEEIRANAYIIPHLQSWLSKEYESIDNLIAALEKEETPAAEEAPAA